MEENPNINTQHHLQHALTSKPNPIDLTVNTGVRTPTQPNTQKERDYFSPATEAEVVLPVVSNAFSSAQIFSIRLRFSLAVSRFRFARAYRSSPRHLFTSRLMSLQLPMALCRKPFAWHSSRAVMISSQSVVCIGLVLFVFSRCRYGGWMSGVRGLSSIELGWGWK